MKFCESGTPIDVAGYLSRVEPRNEKIGVLDMIKWRLPSSAPRDGIPFAAKQSNGVLENCFFDPDQPGFIVNSVVDEKIRLAPTLDDHIGWVPWPVLFEHIQETADVRDPQELNETLDRTISAIELASAEGTRWAPTPKKIGRHRYVINTLLKATVGAFCGLVMLGCGWLMIMTIHKAL